MVLTDKVAVIYGAGGPIDGLLQPTLLGRLATFDDVGNVAAFVASDQARTLTATAVNISCGAMTD